MPVGTFSESVEVVQSTAGEPLHLVWRGRRYTLAADPVRWYQRRDWWDEQTRAGPGEGVGLVDREMWRVQVRRDGGQPLRTFDLVHYLPGGHWRVIKVHDALTESLEEFNPGA
jgi:hypothetical protein